VLSSTLTTVAVFFPIVFVEGVAGQVFGDMALVVVFSLLASLAVALYFVPMLASRRVGHVGGGVGGALLRADILKVGAAGRIRGHMAAPRQGAGGAVRAYGRCLKEFPFLVFELIWRTLLIAAGLACAVLKMASILVWTTLWPALKGVEWVVKKKRVTAENAEDAETSPPFPSGGQGSRPHGSDRLRGEGAGGRGLTFFQKLVRWSLDRRVFGWAGPGGVWDNLTVFRAAEEVGNWMPMRVGWAVNGMEGRRVWRIIQVVLFIVFPLSVLAWLTFWPGAVEGLRTWLPEKLKWVVGGPEKEAVWKALQILRVAFYGLLLPALLWSVSCFLISGAVFVASLARRGLRERARRAARRAVRGLRAASVLILIIYFSLRFVVHLIIALIGKVLVSAAMLAGVVLVCAVWIVGLVVAPAMALLVSIVGGLFERLNEGYPRAIRWALSNRMTVVGVSAASFGVAMLLLAPRLGQELIPEVHQGEFNVEVALPVGTPLEITDRQAHAIEQAVMGEPGVARVSTVTGTEREATSSSDEGENTAKVTAVLKADGDLAGLEDATVASLRERLAGIPQVTTKFSRPALFSFKTPIEVEIRGYDLETLRRVAKDAEVALGRIPGLTDVKSNLQRGSPEVQISYDRDRLARYDLNLMQVASLVRNKVQGQVATRFRDRERRVDVVVKLDEADRQSVRNIEGLVINPNGKVQIPLSAVADVRISDGPSEIRRIDQERAALLTANLAGVDIGTASARIHEALSRMDMPRDFEFIVAGQNKEMETSLRSLKLALLLAMFLVYIVMAAQFESFLHPFVIMFTIPLALVGVLFTLFALGIPLSVMVFLGVIILAGVVVNNAIVLIDYANLLRSRGMSKVEALVQAGHTRLRPILMTTLTTVLGLLPMALGLGEGAELRMPLAVTVIAGLTSSTLLTLVVIPVVYAVMDRKE
jgi:multidrug efflux pump subunit AcrB